MTKEIERPDVYKIILGEDVADLHVAVNEAMRNGWTPLGGMCYVPPSPLEMAKMSHRGTVNPYHQAMVRELIVVEPTAVTLEEVKDGS